MAFSNPRRRDMAGSSEPGLSARAISPLHKGATFHAPTAPTPAADQSFVPPALPRSQSQMADVVDANRRRIEMTLSEIDSVLNLDKLSLSSPTDEKPANLRDTPLPIPRGFLDLSDTDSISSKERQRRVIRPRSVRRGNNHASDSGIGPSVDSCSRDKGSVEGTRMKGKKQTPSASAITRSAAVSANLDGLPALGPKAVNRINEHTIRPLLERPSLKSFEPVVQDLPRRIRSKEIICLRDLEKTLLYMAPDHAKTGLEYIDFTFTSIHCIQATVEYLNDREQVRPGDRPYTNGYFIDLKDQVLQYGRLLAAAKGDESMDIDRNDEIRLHGGLAENGRPAELVRVKKDGTAISIATGKPVDIGEVTGPVQFKRSLSEQREDDEEIMRSMARRKKNATPEELAPKRCREPGCTKEFKRPCDLTKHEKTHSRPWKCPFTTCRYHDFGWPTQKEMDRHVNDKHSDAPAMYECEFKPCPYKSKRESNCKQHMEKAHGWTYVRTKTNGGKKMAPGSVKDTPPSVQQQTPPLANASTPSDSYSVRTPQDNPSGGSANVNGANNGSSSRPVSNEFPFYQAEAEWLASYGLPPDGMDGVDMGMEQLSPDSATSYEQYPPYQNGSSFITDEDIYAATARLPQYQMPITDSMIYGKMMAQLPFQQQQQMPLPMTMHKQPEHQGLQNFQQVFQQQQQQQQFVAPVMQHPQGPHFSPNGQANAMLYTPPCQLEESHDDMKGADFQLFPSGKGLNGPQQQSQGGLQHQSLFGELPSADMGFSQMSQPEIFQQVDLSQPEYQFD